MNETEKYLFNRMAYRLARVVGGDYDKYGNKITVALHDYDNDEPDEPGELAEIEGWDADGCELSWHCELTLGGD